MGQFDYSFGISFRTQRDKTGHFLSAYSVKQMPNALHVLFANASFGKLLGWHFIPLIADN